MNHPPTGGGGGCSEIIHEFGWNGTKKASTGDRFD